MINDHHHNYFTCSFDDERRWAEFITNSESQQDLQTFISAYCVLTSEHKRDKDVLTSHM